MESIVGDWEILGNISSGSFSVVKLVRNIADFTVAAMKIIDLKEVDSDNERKHIIREINILNKLTHRNIIELIEVYVVNDKVYIIMELAEGGELFDYVLEKDKLDQKEARHFFRQLITAVEYCHANFVVHRDLKLENVLLDRKRRVIKLIDFGLSNYMKSGYLLSTSCGSRQYVAPEVLKDGGYVGPASDIWSMGIILFGMVQGRLPFYFCEDDIRKLLTAASESDFQILPCRHYVKFSDLIYKMLEPDSEKRIQLQDLRLHPWVNIGYKNPPPCELPYCPSINVVDLSIVAKLYYFGFKVKPTLSKLKKGIRCQELFMYCLLLQQKHSQSGFVKKGKLGGMKQKIVNV